MPRAVVVSSISLQFRLTTAASTIAAGAWRSSMLLPTNWSASAAFEGIGYSDGAVNDRVGEVLIIRSEVDPIADKY